MYQKRILNQSSLIWEIVVGIRNVLHNCNKVYKFYLCHKVYFMKAGPKYINVVKERMATWHLTRPKGKILAFSKKTSWVSSCNRHFVYDTEYCTVLHRSN